MIPNIVGAISLIHQSFNFTLSSALISVILTGLVQCDGFILPSG
jgi:hypothetical protein